MQKKKRSSSSTDALFSILRPPPRLRFTERSPTGGDGIESFLTYKTKKEEEYESTSSKQMGKKERKEEEQEKTTKGSH